MKRFMNIAYGPHERHRFDLMLPDRYRDEGLILFIHGGAWLSGDKNCCVSQMEQCIADGYAAAAINYRYISDDVHMGALMEDVDAAVKAIAAKAKENGVQLTKMIPIGVSAGAHMALLYAYSYLDRASIRPVGVIDFCGPADLTDSGMLYGNIIGGPDVMMGILNKIAGTKLAPEAAVYAMPYLKRYSPVYHVTPDVPATLICHGQMDRAVPFSVAQKPMDKLEENHVEYRLVPMPHSVHDLDEKGPALSATVLFKAFADRYLRGVIYE